MRLYRFCSRLEYDRFIAGQTLTNISPYGCSQRTLSNPRFYFFSTEGLSLQDIQNNLAQLCGIVTTEILMILETNKFLHKETSKYTTRNPRLLAEYESELEQNLFMPFKEKYIEVREEYTTRTYDNKSFTLLEAYTIKLDFQYFSYTADFTKSYSLLYRKPA